MNDNLSHGCKPLPGRRSTALIHRWRPSAPRTSSCPHPGDSRRRKRHRRTAHRRRRQQPRTAPRRRRRAQKVARRHEFLPRKWALRKSAFGKAAFVRSISKSDQLTLDPVMLPVSDRRCDAMTRTNVWRTSRSHFRWPSPSGQLCSVVVVLGSSWVGFPAQGSRR